MGDERGARGETIERAVSRVATGRPPPAAGGQARCLLQQQGIRLAVPAARLTMLRVKPPSKMDFATRVEAGVTRYRYWQLKRG